MQRRSAAYQMEEHAGERCSVVYYCGGVAEEEIFEFYHANSSLRAAAQVADERGALDHAQDNIRTLLDEDQGGFHEGEVQGLGRLGDVY